jgi:signal peptidase II
MGPMARRRALLTAGAIALLVLAADQASKAWAQGWLPPRRQVTVISGWLWFRLFQNSGATLGLLSGHNALFLAVSVLVAGVIVAILLRGNPGGTLGVAGLGAVAGGTLSNLVDRVRLGSVVDFIEVHLWPTDFNLADAAIRLGVALFLLALLLEFRRRPQPGSGSRPAG